MAEGTYNLGQNLLRQSDVFGSPTTYPNVPLNSRPFPSPQTPMLIYLGRKYAVEQRGEGRGGEWEGERK